MKEEYYIYKRECFNSDRPNAAKRGTPTLGIKYLGHSGQLSYRQTAVGEQYKPALTYW